MTAAAGFGLSQLGSGLTEASGTPAGAASGGTLTMMDEGWTLDNGKTVTKLGAYCTTAESITIKILKKISAGTFTVVVSQAYSHAGGGWQDVYLNPPYTIPNDGSSYYVGFYSASNHPTNNSTRAYKSGDITGSNVTGFTEEGPSQATKAVRAVY